MTVWMQYVQHRVPALAAGMYIDDRVLWIEGARSGSLARAVRVADEADALACIKTKTSPLVC